MPRPLQRDVIKAVHIEVVRIKVLTKSNSHHFTRPAWDMMQTPDSNSRDM
jgi:hypothetical protein